MLFFPKQITKNRKRISPKRRRSVLLRVYFYGLLLLFGIILTYAVRLPFAEPLNIYSVKVHGSSAWSTKIAEFIWHKIFDKKDSIFPTTNIYLIDKYAMQASLMQAYPEIASVDIIRPKLNDKYLELYYQLREPKYIYCGEKYILDIKKDGNECYFMDRDGFIYKKANLDKLKKFVNIYAPIKKGNNNNKPIRQRIEKDRIDTVDALEEAVSKFDMKAKTFYFDGLGNVYIYLDSKYLILREDRVKQAIHKINLFFKEDRYKRNIQYIDLRFRNKIYYKEMEDDETKH